MKKLALLLLCFLCIGKTFASRSGLDSLLNLLNGNIQDTQKIHLYLKIADSYTVSDIVQAKIYLNKALTLQKKVKYEKAILTILMTQGEVKINQEDSDSAMYYFKQAYAVSVKNNNIRMQAYNLMSIAQALFYKGENMGSYDYYNKSLKILKQFKDENDNIAYTYGAAGSVLINANKIGQAMRELEFALRWADSAKVKRNRAMIYNNMGVAYEKMGQYDKCVKNYFQAIAFYEEMGNLAGVLTSYNNIGIIFKKQSKLKDAYFYFNKALTIAEERGLKGIEASANKNLGFYYQDMNEFAKSIEYFEKAEKYYEETNNENDFAIIQQSLSWSYAEIGKTDIAMRKIMKAMEIYKKYEYPYGICQAENYLATVLEKKKDYAGARLHNLQALKLSREHDFPELSSNALNSLYKLERMNGNYEAALTYFEEKQQINDTILNAQNNRVASELSALYETEKKEGEIRVLAKDNLLKESEVRKKQFIIYAVTGISLLLLAMFIMLYRNNQEKKRANEIIQKQKTEVEDQKMRVEEKQREILDSINYAKRIQYTLLAHEHLLNENLPPHFVLFKPKDIVSGDFYWATKKVVEQENERKELFFLAVCDSTGHGVPGAFMSLLNISFLNEAINEKNILQPHEVLNHVKKRLIENVSKEGSQDGMDAILICMESITNSKNISETKIHYAAANNAPILIRNKEIIQLPFDKMPVGKSDFYNDSFTLQSATVFPGDHLYLYTDGFADQFGGPDGKKFLNKRLKELLLINSEKNILEQRSILLQHFEEWKGNKKQIDDVTLLGICFN